MGCVYLLRGQLTVAIYKPQRTNWHTKATTSFYKCLVGIILPAQLLPKQEGYIEISLPARSLPIHLEKGEEPSP
jgi:hypothetical protein